MGRTDRAQDQQLEWNAQGQLTRVISSNTKRGISTMRWAGVSARRPAIPYGPGRTKPDDVCVGRVPAVQETTWQGKRTYLYDAEQPYSQWRSSPGAERVKKSGITTRPDGHGAGGDRAGRDAGVGRLQAGFGENRGDISNSGAYFERRCGCRGSIMMKRRGCTIICQVLCAGVREVRKPGPDRAKCGLNLYAYAPNPLSWSDPLG